MTRLTATQVLLGQWRDTVSTDQRHGLLFRGVEVSTVFHNAKTVKTQSSPVTDKGPFEKRFRSAQRST